MVCRSRPIYIQGDKCQCAFIDVAGNLIVGGKMFSGGSSSPSVGSVSSSGVLTMGPATIQLSQDLSSTGIALTTYSLKP